MIKDSDIPPIRGNPRLGKETERDACVVYGGAQLPKSKRKRDVKQSRRKQQRNFTIRNEEQLKRLVDQLGISAAAVVNLAIARLSKEYL